VKVQMKKLVLPFTALFVGIFMSLTGSASAEGTSMAVLDMQKVLLNSNMGKSAQIELEKKISQLETTFKQEEDDLKALQDDIEKKSSVWSEEKKQEKAIEFQKLRRDLRVKQEDAQLELKQMQDKQVGPILKELEEVVEKYAKDKGIAIIFPKEATLYRSSAVDITEEITQALNAATAK